MKRPIPDTPAPKTPKTPKTFCMGVILSPRGLKGALKVKSFTSPPSNLLNHKIFSTENGQILAVKTASLLKDDLIQLRFEGVETRTEAEALKGEGLHIPRSELQALEEDVFYHADLIGFTALDPEGISQGRITAIYNFGAGDMLEVQCGTQKLLIPFTRFYVPSVDMAQKSVTVLFEALKEDVDGKE